VTTLTFVHLWSDVELLAFAGLLFLMFRKRELLKYKFMSAYLAVHLISGIILVPLIYMMSNNKQFAHKIGYPIYFWVYWTGFALEALLGLGIIYSIYNLAMAPLPGLQRLGRLMFRWAAGIAVAISATTAFGPNVTSKSFVMHSVTQLQQTQSVLTLCLLLFVCLAIQPMGLSHRSKIFGISLGLGFLATTQLVDSAWLSHWKSMYGLVTIINDSATFSALAIWATYFIIPEPHRRMIILPTTSPFLRWNQISLALGDEPGFVAVGEVTPERVAPAEVEVMRRASVKMGSGAPPQSLTGTM
jgi:hypothetical protein